MIPHGTRFSTIRQVIRGSLDGLSFKKFRSPVTMKKKVCYRRFLFLFCLLDLLWKIFFEWCKIKQNPTALVAWIFSKKSFLPEKYFSIWQNHLSVSEERWFGPYVFAIYSDMRTKVCGLFFARGLQGYIQKLQLVHFLTYICISLSNTYLDIPRGELLSTAMLQEL